MRSIVSQLLALGPELATFILTSAVLAPRSAHAISPVAVSAPGLDLQSLGRVAVAGDFDSISMYTYEGQSETAFSKNGSQSLLQQYPGEASFQTLGMSDASIATMCPFVQNGSPVGVILGGNFTSIGGMEAQSAAVWNQTTGSFTALNGLDGAVSTVYCDAERGSVFFGGSFVAPNAMNAMEWITNWTALPFAGFNGPVNAITKNSKGNIVFGGSFDGLSNGGGSTVSTHTSSLNSQVIPLSSGNITAAGTTMSMAGFDEPSNIICKAGQDAAGSTWLLQDGIPGWWQGSYAFGFNPTKLRLYNTNYEGRGTKNWHFENMNSGGVPNLVYTDSNGKNQSCSSVCPLNASNSSTPYQDFYFVPSVGMSEFRIWVTDWYGAGGGLAGIEMFQDDLYSFAVQEFNEPVCDNVNHVASSSTSNPADTWFRVANNGTSSSDWLEAVITDPTVLTTPEGASSINVIFQPNIQQSGNYSILMYTPGCIPDDSCATRGTVNVTGTMNTNGPPISTTVFQNNYYDKFDQIYYGPVDPTSDSFNPEVTLSPLAGQNVPLTVVAQRIRFDIVNSTTAGTINGLYEYDPDNAALTSNLMNSAIDKAGMKLNQGASVESLVASGDDLYVGGSFTAKGISNIMVVNTASTALTGGGLNDAVFDLYLDGTTLYTAGNFTNTVTSSTTGLNNIAAYDTSIKQWSALGAGVNGQVSHLVELSINITDGGSPQKCIAVTGSFTQVNGYGDNDAFNVSGFAVWVVGKSDWLNNIQSATVALQGDLIAMTNVPDYQPVYAGQISSQTLGLSDAIELTPVGSDGLSLQSFSIKLDPTSNSASAGPKTKRAITSGQDYTGVYTGLYFGENNLNITVLGGQFSASTTDGKTVQNLLFINNTHSQTMTGLNGLDADSTIAALATYNNILYAGGSLTGTVNGDAINGLVAYDMSSAKPVSPQPPSLNGDSVVVNAIAAQPDSTDVYFGGNFDTAGSLPCGTLCFYDASIQQWNTPATGLSGTITTMFWSSNTNLIFAGNLNLAGNKTSMASYDSKAQTFTPWPAADTLPGPIEALNAVDSKYDEFWAAGTARNNGSAYLAHYANEQWTSVSGLGPDTTIRGLQILGTTDSHDSTSLIPSDELLLVVGNIQIANYGNASAALFNGTDFTPFLLTNKDDGSQGSIATIFVSNPNNLLNVSSHHLALGLVVLIGLAIALGLICLIIAAGLLMERQRRRSQGYVPMPAVTEKNSAFARVPPETLFGGIKEKEAPKV